VENLLLIATGSLLFGTALFVAGAWRTRSTTRDLLTRLGSENFSLRSANLCGASTEESDGLPTPVRRYLAKVLPSDSAPIRQVTMIHRGTFNLGETTPKWCPFRSRQTVITTGPGFVWEALIHAAPAIIIHVHDAYGAQKGYLTARIWGLLSLVAEPPSPELAQGELLRYLAEAVWYPTALLPEAGVAWTAMDDHHAKATLADGPNIVSAIFEFDDEDLVASITCPDRPRKTARGFVPSPWICTMSHYTLQDRWIVPHSGEVAWVTPEGIQTYWRGIIETMAFEV
jgi:hypothetical protein